MHTRPRPMASLPTQRAHRRLEHGLLALLAIAAAAGLILMAAQPLPALGGLSTAAPQQDASAMLQPASAVAEPPRKRNPNRRSRQSLAMPYFSFAAGN